MKPIVKKLIMIGSFLAVVIALTVTVLVLTQSVDQVYLRGSRIEQGAKYDASLQTYQVGKFESYDQFESSKWADLELVHEEFLKEEVYNKTYFKSNKLALIEFNYEYPDADFLFLNSEVVEGKCDVSVVAIHRNINQKQPSTYYYFYETKEELPSEFTFTIVANYEYEYSAVLCFNEDMQPYLFSDEETPVVFRIKSFQEAKKFIDEAECKLHNRVLLSLRYFAIKEAEESDAVLIRFKGYPKTGYGAYLEGKELTVWSVPDDKGLYSSYWQKEEASSIVMVVVPKDADIDSLRCIDHRKGIEPASQVEYALVRDNESNVEKYNTEITE